MNGLREMLGLKNDEINKLLKELKEQTHSYEEQRQYLIQ